MSSRQPPHCVPETYSNATSWYKIFTTARDSDTKYTQDYNPFWCYKGAVGKVYHTLNPKLTVIVPEVSLDFLFPSCGYVLVLVQLLFMHFPEKAIAYHVIGFQQSTLMA